MTTKLAVFAAFLPAIVLARPAEVAVEAEPHHHLLLENAWVRAFRVEVAPRSETLVHRHGRDYFFVSLGPAEIENDVAGKAPAVLRLRDGEVRFSRGGFAHAVKNLGRESFRNVTIELLQPRGSSGSRGAGKPVELPGGTVAPLLAEDGMQVSEVRLAPGGALPRHHHDTPHLVVAVTDLTLRNEVEGQAAVTRELKAGEAAWVPGGITHTVTNAGRGEARLVTLEFSGTK